MAELVPDWSGRRVAVLGDVVVDRFVYGTVRRISPEAPIPVVEVTREFAVPGGAANVARNVRALGGDAVLLGVAGDDGYEELLRQVLREAGLDDSAVLTVPGRMTTVKTRIIAHHQQVVRVDREVRSGLDEARRTAIVDRLRAELGSCDVLVVSDYAKGVLDPDMLSSIGRIARERGIPYIVDPKPAHFPYPGATVVTPNRDEAAGFFGRAFQSQELDRLAADLLRRTDWGAVLFTLGPDGMALAERGRPLERIPSRVREVFDVTGAGDTVVGAVALGLAAGLPLSRTARLANLAAGVVVGKVGTAVCTPEELRAAAADGA